tara:strand:+ start:60 stop:344 length:285 start_codon:yes stop_codon:yes gene_type:complete
MIEEIRKIWSDDNIKEMACEYTGAEEEYQGFILGCNVLADEIEEQVKKCSIPDVSQQRELLIATIEKVRYNLDGYGALTSSEIAERLEKAINCG